MSRSLNQSRILITGVQGQVGFELVKALGTTGAELVLAGRNLKGQSTFGYRSAEFDLADPESVRRVIEDISPDIVINPAAYTAVDKAEEDKDRAFAVNERGVSAIASAMKNRGGAVIHFSTDYVYNSEGQDPNAEQTSPSPGNVYASSKLAGEQALERSEVAHIILRTSWVYGANGNNFVKTMLRLARERETLRIVDDQIGSPTSAVTLAQAVAAILHQGFKDPVSYINAKKGVYNICDEGYTSWHLFAKEIFHQAEAMGIELKVKTVEGIKTVEYKTPASRPLNSRLSLTKLNQELFIRTPGWQQALALFLHQSQTKLI